MGFNEGDFLEAEIKGNCLKEGDKNMNFFHRMANSN